MKNKFIENFFLSINRTSQVKNKFLNYFFFFISLKVILFLLRLACVICYMYKFFLMPFFSECAFFEENAEDWEKQSLRRDVQ